MEKMHSKTIRLYWKERESLILKRSYNSILAYFVYILVLTFEREEFVFKMKLNIFFKRVSKVKQIKYVVLPQTSNPWTASSSEERVVFIVLNK